VSRNEWLGSEITYTMADTTRGDLTIGAQGEWELRILQQEFAVSPDPVTRVNFNIPDRTMALFAQQEWRFSPRWKADAGVRLDRSHNYGDALSPRLALIYQQSARTVYKAAYGRPFRSPSAFEKYFSDNEILVANPDLRAEHAHTFEMTAEHKFSQRLTGSLNAYQFRTDGLIQEVFPEDGSIPRFDNVERARSTGIGIEASAKLPHDLELLGSATLQQSVDSDSGLALANSPQVLGKLRAGRPVFHHRVFVASSLRLMSARLTVGGEQAPRVFLQDFTLTTRRPWLTGFEVQLGVRNLWNARYDDPVGLKIDTMRQDGRSAYLKLTWCGPR
jgi:outer membrane receptor protein involved in Fe transport